MDASFGCCPRGDIDGTVVGNIIVVRARFFLSANCFQRTVRFGSLNRICVNWMKFARFRFVLHGRFFFFGRRACTCMVV